MLRGFARRLRSILPNHRRQRLQGELAKVTAELKEREMQSNALKRFNFGREAGLAVEEALKREGMSPKALSLRISDLMQREIELKARLGLEKP